MSNMRDIYFVANELAWVRFNGRYESIFLDSAIIDRIVEFHCLDVDVSDYEWIEGISFQILDSMKRERLGE
jgi:hypothetical protein